MKRNTIKMKAAILLVTAAALLSACNNKPSEESKKTEDQQHEAATDHDHEHTYVCPMHPEISGHKEESCSKCGMPLEEKHENATAESFQMQFNSSPESIEAGKPATLILTPKNKSNNSTTVPLDVQHDKKVHLIAVSEDLSWYSHLHPEYGTEGSYTVSETFPSGGNYILYADYKPSGSTTQLEKIVVEVKGKAKPAINYSSIKNTSSSSPFSVLLKPDDGKFIANKDIHFDGVFTKSGGKFDVNQLQNYLGAKGHMVLIHTETKEFMHLHPEVEGSILHFHTHFKNKGFYRAWLQFMDDGKLYNTDYVIQVE